jgi:YHS domain-containing protein
MFGRRDPVCGVKVGRSSRYTAEYGKKTYYFDCLACKHTFEENPARFVGRKAEGLLNSLAKHQDGTPKSCHGINR